MIKLSVVMGTYNESETDLRNAVESILCQTFKNFEFVIILDNPDNDLHKKILNEYSKKDSRVKFFVNEQNIGLAMTLNKGIELSIGEYIARMDADDISFLERFEKQINYLEKNSDITVLGTNKILIDENDKFLYKAKPINSSSDKIAKLLEYESFIVHPSVIFKKSEILNIGGYRNLPTSQDYDLWLRCIENKLKIEVLDEYLLKYRVRNNSISNSNLLKQWCIHEYISKMHNNYKKQKVNIYDRNELNKYLERCNVYDKKEIANYTKGRFLFEEAKSDFKNKKYISLLIHLFQSLIAHKKMFVFYKNLLIYKICKIF